MGVGLALLPRSIVVSRLPARGLCAHLAVGTYIVDVLFLVVSRSAEAAGAKLGAGVKLGEASVAASDPDPVNLDAHSWSRLPLEILWGSAVT